MPAIKREPEEDDYKMDIDVAPGLAVGVKKEEPLKEEDEELLDAKSEKEDDKVLDAKSKEIRDAFRTGSAIGLAYFRRPRIQVIVRKATEGGQNLTIAAGAELKEHLQHAAMIPLKGGMSKDGDLRKSKLGPAVALLLGNERLFGPQITSMAQQLHDRWYKNHDLSPAPLDEGELGDPEGLLRGIVASRPNGTLVYRLDDSWEKVPTDRFGHNGLTVGDWWPFQICALRDGAHGSRMGGIHGHVQRGAFSVVISGGTSYEDNDHDHGDIVYYSGSKGGESIENASVVAPESNGTKSLILSTKHNEPVRVLRSAKGSSRYAPSAGIRYDGLYQVVSYEIRTDRENKKFYQFRLERQQNQDPINMNRPSRNELHEFRELRKKLDLLPEGPTPL